MTITADDVAISLGRSLTGSAEEEQINLWISDARVLIAARLGDLDALDQAQLDYVVRKAVEALVRNPDGSTALTVSVDDGSVTRRKDGARGDIVILDAWWNLLSPASDAKAFSTRPESQADHCVSRTRWGVGR